jgi:hypothetical protein
VKWKGLGSTTTVHAGTTPNWDAGQAQTASFLSQSPLDNQMIRMGGWLYDEYGDSNLTEGMLNGAFDKFIGKTEDSEWLSEEQ